MANTYTQLHVQFIFAVKGWGNVVSEKFREELEKYICAIVSIQKSKPLAIYCNPDHTHILVGIDPTVSVSELAREMKANSSRWINKKKLVKGKFEWQTGFGAFTYSRSQIDGVIKYILNQPEHHRKNTFKDEYLGILKKLDIKFEEEYLFDWYEGK